MKRLTEFSGRDRPSIFWPYAGVVTGTVFVASGVMMSTIMQAVFAASTEIESVLAFERAFTLSIAVMTIAALSSAVLLSAAVVRRLHDIGAPGWIGAFPLIFFLFALALFGALFEDARSTAQVGVDLFLMLMINNLLYLGSLGLLVVLLILPGHKRLNRYGYPPD
ncbi:DUF805 domain-containing protein [Brevundimonas sp. S30B]|nr:DUF805 domain-containing protein [Brevundimonas sp. MF30-B]TFW04634.1 DUF805 domain-containing protein [Brevundimonas sp. S30B]